MESEVILVSVHEAKPCCVSKMVPNLYFSSLALTLVLLKYKKKGLWSGAVGQRMGGWLAGREAYCGVIDYAEQQDFGK